MAKINSRPGVEEVELSDVIKMQPDNPKSSYVPLHLCDKAVYQMASHFFTAREIAEAFNVDEKTVLAHHGEAFRKGKLFHQMKPRILLDKMITDIMNAGAEQGFHSKETEHLFQRATKLIEMKWKKTESNVSEVEVAKAAASVNASDFKFQPLTLENKDEPWAA